MISFWQAVILGLIQGLTEFLPVSSSGHLTIAQSFMQISGNLIAFDIFVHLGTLVAVFVAFWSDIAALLRRPFCRFTVMIIAGTIPAAIMGVLLGDFFETLFSSITAVCCALIVTGVLLWISDHFSGTKSVNDITVKDALLVGIFQGIAITPGLSRSGSTIFGALLCGLKRSEAAKLSFILSIPVILGAAVKQLHDVAGNSAFVFQPSYIVGAIVAAVSGYLAIRIFLRLLARKSLRVFSYYVWALAIVVLILQIV